MSHAGVRFVPESVTLNDLERRSDRRPALSLQRPSFLSITLCLLFTPHILLCLHISGIPFSDSNGSNCS